MPFSWHHALPGTKTNRTNSDFMGASFIQSSSTYYPRNPAAVRLTVPSITSVAGGLNYTLSDAKPAFALLRSTFNHRSVPHLIRCPPHDHLPRFQLANDLHQVTI